MHQRMEVENFNPMNLSITGFSHSSDKNWARESYLIAKFKGMILPYRVYLNSNADNFAFRIEIGSDEAIQQIGIFFVLTKEGRLSYEVQKKQNIPNLGKQSVHFKFLIDGNLSANNLQFEDIKSYHGKIASTVEVLGQARSEVYTLNGNLNTAFKFKSYQSLCSPYSDKCDIEEPSNWVEATPECLNPQTNSSCLENKGIDFLPKTGANFLLINEDTSPLDWIRQQKPSPFKSL